MVRTASRSCSVSGTVFSDRELGFIKIQEMNLMQLIGCHMIYIVKDDILEWANDDVPRVVGFVGNVLGEV
ncbi:MAG: hypothetical protein EU981_04340 [Candidatus Liberibacter ctenarytainae]|uniref:Uncharacterized protein n=1 Tax=Candidatus Liberibacter ctenarytainae TaxID=2020335 RepID=A0A937DLJ9_9HYPH|nr:hypothetical protein [Candidatus Liberibacter ctenarytainae]